MTVVNNNSVWTIQYRDKKASGFADFIIIEEEACGSDGQQIFIPRGVFLKLMEELPCLK